ncbi:MAG: LysM peptidoglycan-binding domain-containing protein [Anaerolineae bacterium]|jgi:LysM repeat protein|nr:LysM peptidoglycan-binding domain-containing protein [Anaerolineae bacterium]
MKWRHWAILIVLVLLNYIIFSTAFTQLAEQRRPAIGPTRTLAPTYESVPAGPVSWVVLPTNTTRPTRTPVTPSPTPDPALATATASPEVIVVTAEAPPPEAPTAVPPTATPSPPPASPTPAPQATVYVVQRGDTLSAIAQRYGVSVQAIVNANGLPNPNQIAVGQRLTIPAAGQAVAPPTPRPAQPTSRPQPTATSAPAPTATQAPPALQFSATLIWDPAVAPNCSGPAVAKQSVVRDTAGNPVNGAVVQADCYGNVFDSHPSGNPGEYDPGHYDFSFGQSKPQDWVCTFRVISLNGQAVTSEVASVHFDVNDCQPHGPGHQVAILNWTKNW